MASHHEPPRPGAADAPQPAPPGAEGKPAHRAPWDPRRHESMTVVFRRVPPDATTLDMYGSLAPLNVLSIDILENLRGERSGVVRVRLTPPPVDYWYDHVWRLALQGPSPRSVLVAAHVDTHGFRSYADESIKTPLKRWAPAVAELDVAVLGQGFLHQKHAMMVMDEAQHADGAAAAASEGGARIRLSVSFRRREISIFVARCLEERPSPPLGKEGVVPAGPVHRLPVEYRIDIQFPWIRAAWEKHLAGGRVCAVLALDAPPQYWRKLRDSAGTHDSDRLVWNRMEQWVRMAFLTMDVRSARDAAVSLHGVFPKGQAVDLGRWTLFRLGLDPTSAAAWKDIAGYLHDYDVRVKPCPAFRFVPRDDRSMWGLLQGGGSGGGAASSLSSLSSLSSAARLSRQLPFEVAYQLEVCISHSVLHESTLDVVFLESLAALAPDRAARMLEYVAERGKRIYHPHRIFRDPKAASYWRRSPSEASSLDKDRAVYIRKAIVTPTTILFSTPALEAGNRVLRHFREHHDRFMRVQFTDELPLGPLRSGRDTRRTDDCFLRAFRALKNGIRVGGRHFEFLAFGNSQLRENSTYFFAPTKLLSCQDIRDWMGDFRAIKSVAKYAARLGQCLSTTRPVPTFGVPTTVQRIADVESGAYCFTDGVGKISKWWARVIASHLRADDVPSAVQFRMGGRKGILVAWPDVPSGQVVQIRPSQEKFSAMGSADVLEIIRCSETATATLNQQTIVLLTSLGVAPSVFLDLLQEELAGLDAVMTEPRKAVAQLTTRIDQNQTTPILADLVKAGFMSTDEPFVWALLQLWRSWTLKALKEKARITVEKSAFVLGCVDETDTLRGHRSRDGAMKDEEAIRAPTELLPQIFLQVPDLEGLPDGLSLLVRGHGGVYNKGHRAKYKVITGLCLVGRNPSLHPGDLRVVEAVDVPALHHLRDVVVFPRTGDQDIPSMCSGGDLDGDDYFVFWDERLLPPRDVWNYKAMDYVAAREPDVDEVQLRHLISFFVQHMKHNTLPQIAMSHRAYADQLEGGAMNPRCLELAQLHSQAVDYAKTGVPALMPARLAPRSWPHWMGRPFKRTYRSATTLGRIYDRVQVETFAPAYDKPFDRRILDHYHYAADGSEAELGLLRRARRIKSQYDLALRRAMAQKDIASEFELWSGFVMNRPRVGSDYKVSEDVGQLFKALMGRFRRLCIREAGNSHDLATLGPFVVAMYKVTHEEVRIALHECAVRAHGQDRSSTEKKQLPPIRLTQDIAPLISFPWLFYHELAALAKADPIVHGGGSATEEEQKPAAALPLLTDAELEKMEYKVVVGVATHHGVPLDISAYDGTREEEGDSEDDEDEDGAFTPLWTLPPGTSEGDVVIDLVSVSGALATGGQAGGEDGHQDDGDDDDDNDNLVPSGTSSDTSNRGGQTADHGTSPKTSPPSPAVSGPAPPFLRAALEDDVLPTRIEESVGVGTGKTAAMDRGEGEGSSNTEEEATGQRAARKAPDCRNQDRRGLKEGTVTSGSAGPDDQTAPTGGGRLPKEASDAEDYEEVAMAVPGAEAAVEDEGGEASDGEEEEDIFATVDSLFRTQRRRSAATQKGIASEIRAIQEGGGGPLDDAEGEDDAAAAAAAAAAAVSTTGQVVAPSSSAAAMLQTLLW